MNRALLLPESRRERPHALFISHREHLDWLGDIDLRPRPHRRDRAADLFKLPEQVARHAVAGIRPDREMRAFDLRPFVRCLRRTGRHEGENGGNRRRQCSFHSELLVGSGAVSSTRVALRGPSRVSGGYERVKR
jgi:hypothetical protein